MSVQRLVDSLARDSTSRLVAALARRLGAGRIAIAEDAVQHALLQALSSWPFKGVPDNPAAWLAVVAKNRALDLLRHEARNVALDDEAFPVEPQQPASDGHFDRELSDDELALLFAVCHPALSPEMRVTFALKTVCGLTVPQIASGLLSEPTAIAQRLVRARKQLETAGVAIEAPPPEALPERAESVRTALYLMFNEGYSASSGEALVQPELLRRGRAARPRPGAASGDGGSGERCPGGSAGADRGAPADARRSRRRGAAPRGPAARSLGSRADRAGPCPSRALGAAARS